MCFKQQLSSSRRKSPQQTFASFPLLSNALFGSFVSINNEWQDVVLQF